MAAPTCNTSSPTQKQLASTLVKLRMQKDELEVKLNGESCRPDAVELQLENCKFLLAQAIEKLDKLRAIKSELEGKIKCLQGRLAERSSAIETLAQFAETEKKKLGDEFAEVTKMLQMETECRLIAQGQLDSSDMVCPNLMLGQNAGSTDGNPFHVDAVHNYPYDSTVERPARYARDQMRNNPIRPIPFPNDAMDEAEAAGACAYNPIN